MLWFSWYVHTLLLGDVHTMVNVATPSIKTLSSSRLVLYFTHLSPEPFLNYHSLIQLFIHDVHALFIINYISIYVIQCSRPAIQCLVVWITNTDVILGQRTSLELSCLNAEIYPSLHPYLLVDLKHIRGKHKELIARVVTILHAMPTASSLPDRGSDNSLKRHRGFLETLLSKKVHT